MEKGNGASDKSEPKLVPGWWKPGGSNQSTAASSSNSDEYGGGRQLRNKFPGSDHNASRTASGCSSSLSQSASSRSSISHDKDNGSHLYSSFDRSHRYRGWDKDLDLCNRDTGFFATGFDSLSANRNVKDTLRWSQSMLPPKQGDLWLNRLENGSVNGVLSRGSVSGGMSRASFEREFPTLVAEGRQGPSEMGRAASPGLSSAVQNLPFGASVTAGDVKTSVLAEVHNKIGGNGLPLPSSLQAAAAVAPLSTGSNTATGLNMAKTLALSPLRVSTDPQLSTDNQKIEELTRRQCSKLIPMTPTTHKSLSLNYSEKLKHKVARGSDFTVLSKVILQPSSQLSNSTLAAAARSDIPKASQAGNFQVLHREKNGVSPTAKNGHTIANGIVSSAAAPVKKIDAKLKSERVDRIVFFDSIRKKSSNNHSSATSQSNSLCNNEKPGDQTTGTASVNQETDCSSNSDLEYITQNRNRMSQESGPSEEAFSLILSSDNKEKALCSDPVDPKEKAFLESLGWKSGDEGEESYITEEEASDFIARYLERIPSARRAQIEQVFANHSGSA